MPDMLVLRHNVPYSAAEGDLPGFACSGQLAQALTHEFARVASWQIGGRSVAVGKQLECEHDCMYSCL